MQMEVACPLQDRKKAGALNAPAGPAGKITAGKNTSSVRIRSLDQHTIAVKVESSAVDGLPSGNEYAVFAGIIQLAVDLYPVVLPESIVFVETVPLAPCLYADILESRDRVALAVSVILIAVHSHPRVDRERAVTVNRIVVSIEVDNACLLGAVSAKKAQPDIGRYPLVLYVAISISAVLFTVDS